MSVPPSREPDKIYNRFLVVSLRSPTSVSTIHTTEPMRQIIPIIAKEKEKMPHVLRFLVSAVDFLFRTDSSDGISEFFIRFSEKL